MQILRFEVPLEPFRLRLLSDLHLGSNATRDDLIVAEFEAARKAGERVALNGDTFDMILTRDNKRYRPECLHPRIRDRSDIANASLEYAADLLGPYADRILFIGDGNHEDEANKHHGVNVTRLLCEKLGTQYAGYCGFAVFRCVAARKRGTGTGTSRRVAMWYHHGAGSGGTVGSAAASLERQLAFVECDLLWLGHRHHRTFVHLRGIKAPMSERATEPVYRERVGVMTGAFMATYASGPSSYGERAGLPPQGTGGCVVEVRPGEFGVTFNVGYDVGSVAA